MFPFIERIGVRILILFAFMWRQINKRVTFVAITGSLGKTTTKELLATILKEQKISAISTFDTYNGLRGIARTMIRVRPWHKVAIFEVAGNTPNSASNGSRLISPDIGVITVIDDVHSLVHSGPEEVVRHKLGLLKYLRPGGVAIVNGADPWLAGADLPSSVKVRRFDTPAPDSLRVDEVEACWPDRLSFRVWWKNHSYPAKTKLVGTQWIPSVLAALAAAMELGVPLDAALAALSSREPYRGRLQPVPLPNGAMLLRDEYNGSLCSYAPALQVLREARVRRRWLVISNITDVRKGSHAKSRMIGQSISESADLCLMIGKMTSRSRKVALSEGFPEDKVLHFTSWKKAALHLRENTADGDLILVRACYSDKLERLWYAQWGEVGCEADPCPHLWICDFCKSLDFRMTSPSWPEGVPGWEPKFGWK
jgi:UDP-N-acetylmuramoyl-tripeptide--D-alanyl-D-alanine ligase